MYPAKTLNVLSKNPLPSQQKHKTFLSQYLQLNPIYETDISKYKTINRAVYKIHYFKIFI